MAGPMERALPFFFYASKSIKLPSIPVRVIVHLANSYRRFGCIFRPKLFTQSQLFVVEL